MKTNYQSWQTLLERDLVGKGFIYNTPYGGITRGVIKGVSVVIDHLMLPDKNKEYEELDKYSKIFRKSEFAEGWRPVINIISTIGIPYNMDEIYIEYAKKSSVEAGKFSAEKYPKTPEEYIQTIPEKEKSGRDRKRKIQ